MEPLFRAFIGLGSNLDDPRSQLLAALDQLAAIPGTRLVAVSSIYQSAPVGPPDQPDYLNAVAELATSLAPEALLDALQAIETKQGRVRGRRWGERTLDLDLLLYGDQTIESERLVVPHPQMKQRAFVLIPLQEIAPGLSFPDGESIVEAVSRLGNTDLRPAAPARPVGNGRVDEDLC